MMMKIIFLIALTIAVQVKGLGQTCDGKPLASFCPDGTCGVMTLKEAVTERDISIMDTTITCRDSMGNVVAKCTIISENLYLDITINNTQVIIDGPY